MGLILERKAGESLEIKTPQGSIFITPLSLVKDRGKFAIDGPREIQVKRVDLDKYSNVREEAQERIDYRGKRAMERDEDHNA